MDTFTPVDTIRALFAPLTTCFASRRQADDEPGLEEEQGRREELEGLLADDERDADIMSLRSEGGRGRRQRKSKKKSIRMCGLELYGRRRAEDLLDTDEHADEEDEDDLFDRRRSSRSPSPIPPDSDAPSLTPSQIALLAKTRFQQPRAQTNPPPSSRPVPPPPLRTPSIVPQDDEEQEELADALVRSSNLAFEGFPGSGNEDFDFGEFIAHSPVSPVPNPAAMTVPQRHDDEEPADFGAIFARHSQADSLSYASRPRSKGGSSSSGTPSLASHVPSRSRTNTKRSRSKALSPPSESSATDSVRTPSERQYEGGVPSGLRSGERVDGGFPSTGLSRVGSKGRF